MCLGSLDIWEEITLVIKNKIILVVSITYIPSWPTSTTISDKKEENTKKKNN